MFLSFFFFCIYLYLNKTTTTKKRNHRAFRVFLRMRTAKFVCSDKLFILRSTFCCFFFVLPQLPRSLSVVYERVHVEHQFHRAWDDGCVCVCVLYNLVQIFILISPERRVLFAGRKRQLYGCFVQRHVSFSLPLSSWKSFWLENSHQVPLYIQYSSLIRSIKSLPSPSQSLIWIPLVFIDLHSQRFSLPSHLPPCSPHLVFFSLLPGWYFFTEKWF